MERRHVIALIDPDLRRRAAMTHRLDGAAIHIEPFETVGELQAAWPRADAVLIADEDDAIGELIERMAEHEHWLPLIAFADAPTTERVVQAVLAGAVDYLTWPCTPEQVLDALAGAEKAGAALRSLKLREARARSRLRRLTRREREVLEGVAGGLSNRMIGERLSISPRTVEIHRANLLTKMDAKHTSEAIRIAIEASLIG